MRKSKIRKPSLHGFTLLEMLLVLGIMTSILMMIMNYSTLRFDQFRRDKTIVQMQDILNASLAYYVANGKWPVASCVSTGTTREELNITQTLYSSNFYKPSTVNLKNPYGGTYSLACTAPEQVFQVSTTLPKQSDASLISASVPLGTTPTTVAAVPPATESSYEIMAQANIPGQNLNNARSLNFAGLYKPGQCVPVPSCPYQTGASAPSMTPQIYVVPVAISGVNYNASGTAGTAANPNEAYALKSFSAYATAPSTGTSVPAKCTNGVSVTCTTSPTNGAWRVCAQVITSAGDVQLTNKVSAGRSATLAAFTRCAPENENTIDKSLSYWAG